MNTLLKTPFTLNIAGSCGSGKSFFIKYLVSSFQYSQQPFDCIMVFSNTGQFTQDYEFLDRYKHAGVFNALDYEEKLKKIMEVQKMNRQRDKCTRVLLIFDDIFGTVKDSKKFKDLVSTHRHYNISLIFSVQHVCGTAAYLREISQYLVIFDQKTKQSLQVCYENYFIGEFDNFTTFKNYFKNKLQKYHFFFIDRQKNEKPKIMVCPE